MAELRGLPGASYRTANAFIVARRKILKLQDPFEMDFNDWGPGNRSYDWYHSLSNRYIQTIHLRKERESPFYHEFIVFRLRGDRPTFWRIDRRQLPDEQTPLNSIYTEGVPARDTIEQVTSLESRLEVRSNCMVEIDFQPDVQVDVGLVLKICRAIKADKNAKVYTLQRYNCFFFAQTLIMCTTCGVSDWAGLGGVRGKFEGDSSAVPWKTPNTPYTKEPGLDNAARRAAFKWNPTDDFEHNWDQLSRLSNALVHASPLLRHADHCDYCLNRQDKTRQRSLSSEIDRVKHQLIDHWNALYRQLLEEIYCMNHAKFVASGVWKIIDKNQSGEDSKKLIDEKMVDIEKEWETYYKQVFSGLLDTVGEMLEPKECCDAWYPDLDEWKSTSVIIDGGPVKAAREEWEKATENFFQGEFPNLQKALEDQAMKSGIEAHTRAMTARVESFKRTMTIKLRVPV
ncbi:unnamed protein product [Rhizoctonia solani]|uniref:Uncharacterized protein n=1 Tax=Rhizoctonia solani TaxID=456999 RepID=A0A8H2XY54_9AGAM|nr:unnamed protein product [Rhizoctonia solani]